MRLLFLTDEPWPTFRPDIAVLFGRVIPDYGVYTDLLTHRGDSSAEWTGGRTILYPRPRSQALYHLSKLLSNAYRIFRCKRRNYDAIQVRGMPVHALVALIAAKVKGLQFYYWMSFPQSEAQVQRAMWRGPGAGLKYWFPLIQGYAGQFLLYHIILPRCDHIFVQSQKMVDDVVGHGVPARLMSPVQMAVDTTTINRSMIHPSGDTRLLGKRVIVYLGTFDRERNVEILLQMLSILHSRYPDVLLVMVGDSNDREYLSQLKCQADRLGVADAVMFTGWLPTKEALSYVRAAEIGLSPFPRGPLLDSATPTKAIEYMALGVPVVANDNPDQAQTIKESGAGICVPLSASTFASAVDILLNDSALRNKMGDNGTRYIQKFRSYARIAQTLASTYKALQGNGENDDVSSLMNN